MNRTKKLIIAILVIVLIGLIAVIFGALFSGPDLSSETKNILVLASDKEEQSNGGVDMAFMIRLEKLYSSIPWRNDTSYTARPRRSGR